MKFIIKKASVLRSRFTRNVYKSSYHSSIPFFAQPLLELEYKGMPLTQFFRPDFICYEKIVVEIKTVASLADAHRSQTLNYLNATKFDLALLINFGQHPKLAYERIVNERSRTLHGAEAEPMYRSYKGTS